MRVNFSFLLVPLLPVLLIGPAEAQNLISGTHTGTLVIDADNSGTVSPGDTIEYSVELSVDDEVAAQSPVVTMGLDPNLRLVPGSLDVTPYANPDYFEIQWDRTEPLTGNLLTNDAGKDPGETFVVTQVGDGMSSTIFGTFGELTWNPDGSFSYQANTSLTAMIFVIDSESFDYVVSDGKSTSTGTLEIIIFGPSGF